MDPIYIILAIIGFLVLAYLAIKFLCSLFHLFYPYFIARPKDLRKLAGAKWAVITGSSDGIGKQYAMELANRGFNIMLISRSADKLRAVKEEILRKSIVKTEVQWIAFDFTNGSVEAFEKSIFPELENLAIGILVNNVGVAHAFRRFHDIPGGTRKIGADLIVNTVPHTLLSAFVLKQMVARKNGIIINVASFFAYWHAYHNSIYCSVKKYLQFFTEILRKDYAGTGIIIQTIFPGFVHTNMAKFMAQHEKPGFFAPTPETLVRQALRTVGHVDETSGCFAHQLQKTLLLEWTPSWLGNLIINQMMKKLVAKQNKSITSA